MMSATPLLVRDQRGVAAAELALVLPLLLLLSVGAADISSMAAARSDLQQAAAQTAALAMARPPQTGDTAYLKNVAVSASGLAASDVIVAVTLTCDGAEQPANVRACVAGAEQARYVTVRLNGRFSPSWGALGLPATVPIAVEREVRIQ